MLTDKPNLHHIFPSNFIASNPGKNRVDVNSLMNIAYITQLTNIRISDKNPIDYIAELDKNEIAELDKNEFRTVLRDHLVPLQIVDWAHDEALPEDALDKFVDLRVELFIEQLAALLPGIPFRIFDSRRIA